MGLCIHSRFQEMASSPAQEKSMDGQYLFILKISPLMEAVSVDRMLQKYAK